jgi:hypothetical protein
VLAEAHDAPPGEMEPVLLRSFGEAFSFLLACLLAFFLSFFQAACKSEAKLNT